MRFTSLLLLLVINPAALWSQGTPEINFREGMLTRNGFSAELRLNANKSIFEELAPDPAHLERVEVAKRGIPFYTVILFANAASDGGRTNVTYDIVIKKPGGVIYGEAKGMPGWKNRPLATPGLVHIATGTIKIKIDPEDPSGKYTVEAEIHDNARNTTIHCAQGFLVE